MGNLAAESTQDRICLPTPTTSALSTRSFMPGLEDGLPNMVCQMDRPWSLSSRGDCCHPSIRRLRRKEGPWSTPQVPATRQNSQYTLRHRSNLCDPLLARASHLGCKEVVRLGDKYEQNWSMRKSMYIGSESWGELKVGKFGLQQQGSR